MASREEEETEEHIRAASLSSHMVAIWKNPQTVLNAKFSCPGNNSYLKSFSLLNAHIRKKETTGTTESGELIKTKPFIIRPPVVISLRTV